MARIFDFLGKKVNNAEFNAVLAGEIERASIKELALHIATSYIANALSKCEIKVYENGEAVKDKWYYRLNVSPNDNENASQFINKVVDNYFYKGEALVIENNDKLYCADSFHCDTTNPLKEYVYENVVFKQYQSPKKYKANKVLHFKLENKNVKNLIDGLFNQYEEIIAYALQSYKGTNGKKYKLMLDNYTAGDKTFLEQFENVIKKQLKTFIENENAVYPEFKGTKLEEFTTTAGRKDTSDIVAMRKEVFETTSQAFKIPLSMMYGNITNMQEIVKVFLTFGVDPIAVMFGDELTRKRYGYDGWKKGNFIEVDTSCINYVDLLEVADNIYNAVASGVVNVDELRPRLRLKPLNTEFSTSYFVTKNYDLAENALKNIDGDEKGGGEE